MVSCGYDGWIKVWDTETNTCILSMERILKSVHSVLFSPDGKYIIYGGHDKKVNIYELEE